MKKLLLILLTAASLFECNGQTTLLTNGLIAYYPFTGNAADMTGNGHNALVTNATQTNNQVGLPDAAYFFSGSLSDQYIEITNTTDFPSSTNDFTVSLWVNFSQLEVAGNFQILFCGHSSDSFQLDVNTINATNATVDLHTGTAQGTTNDLTSSAVPWTLNQWYNLQIVRFQNTLEIFRNAQLIGQSLATFTNAAAGQNIDFGYRFSNIPAFPLYGALTDIRFYNRALSQSETVALYQYEAQPLQIALLPGILITGEVGSAYNIQYATSLNPTNWTTLVSNIVINATPYLYVDTNVLGQPQRFYRLVSP